MHLLTRCFLRHTYLFAYVLTGDEGAFYGLVPYIPPLRVPKNLKQISVEKPFKKDLKQAIKAALITNPNENEIRRGLLAIAMVLSFLSPHLVI